MFNTTKLSPISVTLANVSAKGWTLLPEVDSIIWIVKNDKGTYSEPYQVRVVASVEIDANDKGCLVYITTHVEDYFNHVSSMFDIIGTSESDVRSKAARIYAKQQEAARKRNEMIAAFRAKQVTK